MRRAMYSHGNKGMVPRAVPIVIHYIVGLGYPKLKAMYLSLTSYLNLVCYMPYTL